MDLASHNLVKDGQSYNHILGLWTIPVFDVREVWIHILSSTDTTSTLITRPMDFI